MAIISGRLTRLAMPNTVNSRDRNHWPVAERRQRVGRGGAGSGLPLTGREVRAIRTKCTNCWVRQWRQLDQLTLNVDIHPDLRT